MEKKRIDLVKQEEKSSLEEEEDYLCMVLDLCSMLCIFTAVNLTLTCKCQREECRIGAWSSRECCSPLSS